MQEDRPLASHFENFEAAPSDALWGKIEAGLSEKRKKRPVLWWFWGSAATLILTLGIIKFYSGENATLRSNGKQSRLNSVENKTETASKNTSISENPSVTKQTNGTKNPSKFEQKTFSKKVNSSPSSSLSTQKNKYSQNKNESLQTKAEITTENLLAKTPKVETENIEPTITKSDSAQSDELSPNPPFTFVPKLEDEKLLKVKGFELGFSFGFGRGERVFNPPVPISPSTPPNTTITASFDQENVDPNINYWLPVVPIQLQFTIGKEIRKKFKATTGLGLSIYSEKTRLLVPDEFVNTRRNNVLQLPVSFDYKIIQKQKLEWTTGPGVILGYNRLKDSEQTINHFTTTLQWQTALRFHLKNNWSVFLQPHYRYQISDNYVLKSAFYHNHFYGLNLGMVRRF